ncbi:unnamed protein product, partial [Urochloa humidicola]
GSGANGAAGCGAAGTPMAICVTGAQLGHGGDAAGIPTQGPGGNAAQQLGRNPGAGGASKTGGGQ